MENLVNSSPLILVLIFLVIGFAFLMKGADFFVEGSSSIAKRLKVPPIIIGLTIVAMGTSLPETAVSVTASLVNNNELAVSNVVGSNIFNLMVVVGVCSILTPILVQKETIRRDIPFSMICALLLLGLGILAAGDTIGMRLGHLDGMILLGFFAGYIVVMIQSAMKARAAGKNVDMEGMEELEEEIGTPLFVRSNRNVTLTDAGMLFRRRVEELIALEDKIKEEFGGEQKQLTGTVSIGMAEAFSANIVADAISDFRVKYPAVKFELFTAMADIVLERIDKGILDIGFLLEPVNVDKYDFIRLPHKERLGLYMRTDDPLAQKSEVLPEDMKDLPLIVPMRRELQQNSRNVLGAMYDNFNKIATFNVVNNASLLAERGTGYVLVIEGATQYHHNPNLCFRPIKGVPELHCLAVWKKFQPSNRAVSLFLEDIAMLSEH